MSHCIALDWGTSSFRAYLLDAEGHVRERREAAAGILSVKDGAFDAEMEKHIADWSVELPVIASGMITSRQGWVEVPYVKCPAGAGELASGMLEHHSARSRPIHFVPGMSRHSADGVPDVMRGEEVQVIGALAGGDELLVAPGTHSKWIDARDGVIFDFSTYMTGEMFAVLRQHSILGRLMSEGGHDDKAFDKGLAAGFREPGALLHTLFSTRTLGLFGQLPEAALASYLSGMLIGAETGHAVSLRKGVRSCIILASQALGQLYVRALRLAGIEARLAEPDVVVKGLYRIGTARGLLA